MNTKATKEVIRFTTVTLHPLVAVLKERMKVKQDSIHYEANKKCFIANSCNFPIMHDAKSRVAE